MINHKRLFAYPALAWLLVLPLSAAGQELDQMTQQGETRIKEGATAQQQIDNISTDADGILNEYKTTAKIVDGLKIYNNLFQTQIDNQQKEMGALQDSIGNVSLIERQIVPLMTRMIESLESFISLDVPFLSEERSGRIERLRNMMVRADVTAAEKFRRVIEAYQIENEYGRTIEAYKGSLEIEGKEREVDFLRIGRVALLYQSIGGELTGAWNQQEKTWQALPPEQYKKHTAIGLRIARKQIAPQLLVLPIVAASGAGQ